MRLAGLEAERCLNEGLKSKFDLTLYIREGASGLYFSFGLQHRAVLAGDDRGDDAAF